jgi:hypothetical protein
MYLIGRVSSPFVRPKEFSNQTWWVGCRPIVEMKSKLSLWLQFHMLNSRRACHHKFVEIALLLLVEPQRPIFWGT